MSFMISDPEKFIITIEVVPPAGNDPADLLDKLAAISGLAFDGFSVAFNPVAKPRMSATVFCHLLHQKTGKPAILHLTVRDHNLLGLQAELWGAKALGIDTLIAITGDPSAGRQKDGATAVNDVTVYQLITLGNESGLTAGAVLDFRPERNGLKNEVKRLEKRWRPDPGSSSPSPYMTNPRPNPGDACAHLPVPKSWESCRCCLSGTRHFFMTRWTALPCPNPFAGKWRNRLILSAPVRPRQNTCWKSQKPIFPGLV